MDSDAQLPAATTSRSTASRRAREIGLLALLSAIPAILLFRLAPDSFSEVVYYHLDASRLYATHAGQAPPLPHPPGLAGEILHDLGLHPDVDLTVYYIVQNGLFNQHYGHLDAFMIAEHIGAAVVLPTATSRKTFNVEGMGGNEWFDIPLESLLDVDALVKAWWDGGVKTHRSMDAWIESIRDTAPFAANATSMKPGTTEMKRSIIKDDAVLHVTVAGKLKERTGLVYHHRSIEELRAQCRRDLAAALEERRANGRDPSLVRHVLFSLNNPMYAVSTRGRFEAAQRAAERLPFAPELRALAEKAVAEARRQITEGVVADVARQRRAANETGPLKSAPGRKTQPGGDGQEPDVEASVGLQGRADQARSRSGRQLDGARGDFNVVHLRMEPDARHWVKELGGYDELAREYAEAMDAAGMDNSTPVYVSSGLLGLVTGADRDTPNGEFAAQLWDNASEKVLGPRSSFLMSKETLLSAEDLDGLVLEQVAAIDFLIASKGARFVGFGRSSFSVFLAEAVLREAASGPKDVLLLDFPGLGNSPYFYSTFLSGKLRYGIPGRSVKTAKAEVAG